MIDSEAPNLTDGLNAAIRYNLSNVHTAFPAKILKYANRKADVQPSIKKVYLDGRVENYPVIPNVPVMFPRTANAVISLPIKKGDLVLVIITERSIDEWLEKSGEEVTPASNRRFDLSDAIAIPGCYPFGTSLDVDENAIVIRNGLTTIKIDDDGKLEMGNSSAQLLDTLDQLLTKLLSLQILVVGGSSSGSHSLTPTSIADITAVQTLLTQIKGSL